MASGSRPWSWFRSAPEVGVPVQVRVEEPNDEYEPDESERDFIAEILANFAKDCDEAFSIASGKSLKSTKSSDSLSITSLRQEELDRIRANRLSLSRLKTMQNLGSTNSPMSAKSNFHEGMDDEHVTPTTRDGHHEGEETTPVYPSRVKTAVIMFALYISIFLVALDRTIIGPAIPVITNEFNSIGDIGWYGSAYMLTAAGFILLYGRIYTFFPTKPVFLFGIFLFELGSVFCGAATSSTMLIVGRAIAGLGSSGIFTGAILIMLNTVPLHKRPLLQGLFGACFGVASVAGPLLGGAFTGSSATWRWCFYINLPLEGLTVLIVVFLLKLEEHKPKLATWLETTQKLDPVGTLLFLPSITCLLLALEWGATEYPWSSPHIIALLTVFAVLLVTFVAWQFYTRNTVATIPARVIFQRSVAFGGLSQFCVGATMLTVSIYIPLWFQAIKGASAMQSGINTIPLVLSVVVGSIISGGLTQRIGYYTPFMILGSSLMAVGAGLVTTWNPDTKSNAWIGFQILLGFGVGCTMQHPNLAVQIVLAKPDIPTGTAFLSLCQTLGGAVFTTVGQNLYIKKFSSGLQSIGGLDPKQILEGGATDLADSVPSAIRNSVIEAYNHSLTQGTFLAALIVACIAVPAALGMEWRSVKQRHSTPDMIETQEDKEKMERAMQESRKPSLHSSRTAQDVAQPRIPPLKKLGMLASMLTVKVNPDLRDELRNRRQA
ncbi:major facilitator superfamily domain-containing protein [Ampelomyces quisqualis]|uniref:Major facilitator superfamily domain-containing protein n=1 Tax=Ampelomyces quisqualis TaxID=50730 RepID=A0A6A5R1C1_AMPQU|nr:major facilitator superfamily domain-containing protein [Ampelomyces quisqualis]